MYDSRSVTLAIPCCNAARHIGAALDSAGKLDPAPHEIIVVDDGSTDGSREIVARYPRIRQILHEENLGIAASRNMALRNASGEIIVYMDADVIARTNLIASLIRHYGDDEVAGVGGQGREVYKSTRYDKWRGEVLFQGWGEYFRSSVPFLFGLCSSYRRRLLERMGGFNTVFKVSGEDMDMSFRLRKEGYRLCYEPEAVVEHLRRDDRDSLEKMTYRHCFWGFVAQRLNRCRDNKVPMSKSLKILIRQILVDGIAKGDLHYAWLTLHLHRVIFRAWIDAGRYARGNPSSGPARRAAWEGHGR